MSTSETTLGFIVRSGLGLGLGMNTKMAPGAIWGESLSTSETTLGFIVRLGLGLGLGMNTKMAPGATWVRVGDENEDDHCG